MLEKLREHVEQCPVVMKGNYPYIILSLTDGINRIDPAILKEIIERMKEIGDFNIDCIVTPEAMGIPYAVPLSLELGIPFNVIRKRRYDLEGEIEIVKRTGYAESKMYINGIGKGDRVLLIDDMISTGGTLKAILEGLKKTGCTVVQVLVAVEKGCHSEDVSKDVGIPVKAVFGLDIIDNKAVFRYTGE